MSATWRLETGNGSSYLWKYNNNAGGIKCSSASYCTYESKEVGMQELENLLKGYVKKYGFNYKEIRRVYSGMGEQDYQDFMEVFSEEYRK